MLNLHRYVPIMARSDHTARMLQTLGYLTISRRNLHKLVVRELSEKTTHLSLLNYYTRFGDVRAFRVLDDSSPRVAFIYYDKIKAINRALKSGEHVVDERTVIHDKMECQDDELDEADYRLATSNLSKPVRTKLKYLRKKLIEQPTDRYEDLLNQTIESTLIIHRPKVSCEQIRKYYQQFGEVVSVSDIIRLEACAPRSRLVTFSTREQPALEMLNLHRCKPIMARRDHTARMLQTLGYLTISRRNLHKLVVRELSEKTTHLSLLKYYTRFGDVRAFRINRALKSGYRVVDERTVIHDKMDCCLETSNISKPVRTKLKYLRKKLIEQPTDRYEDLLNETIESTLIIHRPKVSPEQIRKYYQQFGEVVSVSDIIRLEACAPRSRLVTFSTREQMKRAIDNRPNKINDNVELDDHHVRCSMRTYVIKNLSPLATNESLWKQLRPAGPMFECTVVHDSINGKSSCHAYVTFWMRTQPVSVITDLAVMDGVIPTVEPYRHPERIRSSSDKLNNDSKISSTPLETNDPKSMMGRFMTWLKGMIDGQRKLASQPIQDEDGPIKKL
ncbi:hypothetical protein Ddc_15358 [Ditylenchus destructor]|nr:hypothetical protein Ddc_15358 [Ditylenchus destructor]